MSNYLRRFGARVAGLFFERPAEGLVGHYAHVAVLFAYGTGVAAAAVLEVFRRRTSLMLRFDAPGWFVLYLFATFWLLLAWAFHVVADCARCDRAVHRLLTSDRAGAPNKFRGYHFVARWNTWFYFQVLAIATVGFLFHGFFLAWLAVVPLLLFVVQALLLTAFHTRVGFLCPVCRVGGSRHREVFPTWLRREDPAS